MQDTQKISEIALRYATKEDSNMKKFNKESLIKRFQQDTAPKEFYDSYKVLFWIAIILAFVMQFASAFSAYNYIDQMIKIKIAQIDLRFSLVIATLVFTEVIKYHLYSITLQKAFARPRHFEPFLIILTLLVSTFSFYASISGGGEMGVNKHKENFKRNLWEKKIQEKEKQIQDIQTSEGYKKIQWLGNGKTALVLSPEGLELIKKRETELSEIKKEMRSEIQKINQENRINRKNYEYAFGTFEMIFILCQLFIWHFKRSSAQDREISDQINSTKEAPENPITKNDTLREVEKKYPSKLEVLLKEAELNDLIKQNKALKFEPLTIKKVEPIGFRTTKPESKVEVNHKPKSIFEVNNKALQSPIQSKNTSKEALQSPIQSEIKSQIQSELESKFKEDKDKLEAEKEEFEAIKEKFEATLKSLQIKKAKYLKKYEDAVKLIMQLEALQKTDSEIRSEITDKFKISEGTYYNIKRILNNPTN